MLKEIKRFITGLHNAKISAKEDPFFLGMWYRTFFDIEIWFVRTKIDLPNRKHLFWVFYRYIE